MPAEATAPALEYPFAIKPGLDLDARFDQLRRDTPVVQVTMPYGGKAWLVTSHAESKIVQADPRFSRVAATAEETPRFMPTPLPQGIIQSQDPPEHTRLRRLVTQAFTVRRVELLRPRVQELADQLLDDMMTQGPPADFATSFAFPMPLTVICELLGVPFAERDRFRRFAEATLSTTAFTAEETMRATSELQAYLAELIEERRREPTDDLLSALVHARDADDRLSEQELLMLGIVILVGGQETTTTQILNFAYMLLVQPWRFAALVKDPGLIPGAVEELLRYIPLGTVGSLPRVATEDVEIGGVTIRAGEAVITHVGAANRDEKVFPDAGQLDFARDKNPHLAFGHGVHHCLGAHLARLELQIALRTLTRRLPGLRLAAEDEIPWKSGLILRGPMSLPIAW